MAEDKKKKTTNTNKKVNTTKKPSPTKKNTTQNNKKKQVNKNTKQQPKKPTKKVETKKVAPKEEVKKQQPKKVETPKEEKVELETTKVVEEPVVTEEIEKIIEVETETNNEDSFLEKTLIFDGRENQNLAEVVENLEAENVVLEDKIIKRSKAKKITVMVLTALIIITIIGTISYVIHSEIVRINSNQTLNSDIYSKVLDKYKSIEAIDTNKKNNTQLTKEDYKNIVDISLGQFEKKILEKEDMIVMVTSTTCLYSIEYEPIIDEVFKELNKTIYRINITSLTKEENNRFRSYYAYKKTPTIFTVKNGVVKNDVTGKLAKAEIKRWLDENM